MEEGVVRPAGVGRRPHHRRHLRAEAAEHIGIVVGEEVGRLVEPQEDDLGALVPHFVAKALHVAETQVADRPKIPGHLSFVEVRREAPVLQQVERLQGHQVEGLRHDLRAGPPEDQRERSHRAIPEQVQIGRNEKSSGVVRDNEVVSQEKTVGVVNSDALRRLLSVRDNRDDPGVRLCAPAVVKTAALLLPLQPEEVGLVADLNVDVVGQTALYLVPVGLPIEGLLLRHGRPPPQAPHQPLNLFRQPWRGSAVGNPPVSVHRAIGVHEPLEERPALGDVRVEVRLRDELLVGVEPVELQLLQSTAQLRGLVHPPVLPIARHTVPGQPPDFLDQTLVDVGKSDSVFTSPAIPQQHAEQVGVHLPGVIAERPGELHRHGQGEQGTVRGGLVHHGDQAVGGRQPSQDSILFLKGGIAPVGLQNLRGQVVQPQVISSGPRRGPVLHGHLVDRLHPLGSDRDDAGHRAVWVRHLISHPDLPHLLRPKRRMDRGRQRQRLPTSSFPPVKYLSY